LYFRPKWTVDDVTGAELEQGSDPMRNGVRVLLQFHVTRLGILRCESLVAPLTRMTVPPGPPIGAMGFAAAVAKPGHSGVPCQKLMRRR